MNTSITVEWRCSNEILGKNPFNKYICGCCFITNENTNNLENLYSICPSCGNEVPFITDGFVIVTDDE